MDKDDNQTLEALTEASLQVFHEKIQEATRKLYERWESRDEMDSFYLTLDVLFFRNCKMYETIDFLLCNGFLNGAEMILRALYEGVVIFEWCMIDPKRRALRFRHTSMGGTLQLINQGYLKDQPSTPKI